MASTTFDTLGYFDKLKAAGFTEQQARVQADALRELIEDKLATKRDLKELEAATKRDLKELELRLKYDLTVRFGSMLAAAVAILAVLIVLVR